MSLRALDEALVRLAAARSGAVARVAPVSQTEGARPVDPARGTDPRWLEIPRPDPATIPVADIVRFQALVHAPEAEGIQSVWVADALARAAGGQAGGAGAGGIAPAAAAEFPPHAHSDAPMPPADRIVGTLHHLRGLHGL